MSCLQNELIMENLYEEGYDEGVVIGEDEYALSGQPLVEFAEAYAEAYAKEKFENIS